MLALGSAAACGSSPSAPARLSAVVIRAAPNKDTVRFEAPATAAPCGRATLGLVLKGSSGGNGVMIWVRSGDSAAWGDFSLLARGDSSTARGAVVALRFMVGDAAHGVTLDSGAVSVTHVPPGRELHARVRGSGRETVVPSRVALDARFEAVPLARDTVTCMARP